MHYPVLVLRSVFAAHIVHSCQLSTVMDNIVEPESGVTMLNNVVEPESGVITLNNIVEPESGVTTLNNNAQQYC